VDAWRTPKRIFDVHPPDQYLQLCLDLRSSTQGARLPTPVAAKTGPVPTHEGLGPDDRDNLQDRRTPAIELDKELAIIVCEPGAATQPTLQDNQLMSKHRILSLKPHLRLDWQRQHGLDETQEPDHSASLVDSIAPSTRIRFSVHTGVGASLSTALSGLLAGNLGRAADFWASQQWPWSLCVSCGCYCLKPIPQTGTSTYDRSFSHRDHGPTTLLRNGGTLEKDLDRH
jgi:hypothetical protein